METSDDPIGPVSGRSHEENEGKRPTSHRAQTCILYPCCFFSDFFWIRTQMCQMCGVIYSIILKKNLFKVHILKVKQAQGDLAIRKLTSEF